MFIWAFAGLTAVAHLAFVGLLLLLSIRTQSKGLLVLLLTYVSFTVINALPNTLFDQYIHRWVTDEMNNWLTENMSVGGFMVGFGLIERFFFYSLNLVGIFLTYKEWRLGKFRQPHTSEPNSAPVEMTT